jgi:hypothetical protein
MQLTGFLRRRRALAVSIVAVVACYCAVVDIRHLLLAQMTNPSWIHVVEATYGESCQKFGHSNLVKAGNATVIASLACDNTDVYCPVYVDPAKLGDPAVGCDKDFSVSWRCGADQAVHHTSIAGNSTHYVAWLSCLAARP